VYAAFTHFANATLTMLTTEQMSLGDSGRLRVIGIGAGAYD